VLSLPEDTHEDHAPSRLITVPYSTDSKQRPAGIVRRIGTRLLHGAREALPAYKSSSLSASTLLCLRQISSSPVGNFLLITLAALVVGKTVLVAVSCRF
jgi:hypothetical protein